MALIYRALGLMLNYPDEDQRRLMPAILDVVAAESRIPAKVSGAVTRLGERLSQTDLYDLQEDYVQVFDRTRSLSLNLYEHVHGESRDRGQAMVDLKTMYEDAGFEIDAKELPDYLPLFLEFLSTRTEEEATELLAQTAHIAAALKERLKKRDSVYVNAFGVLEALGQGRPDAALLRELQFL